MTKAHARRVARERLAMVDPDARGQAARCVSRHVWSLPEFVEARAILLYAEMPDEIPVVRIATEARRRGVIVTYPRCLPETREMALHRVELEDELGPGAYGILEPALSCPILALDEIDAAIVPGLAWDRTGARLGRGAGYYDRLFADPAWRGFTCGVFLDEQELPGLPVDPWDRPLEAVVTPARVWRFTGASDG